VRGAHPDPAQLLTVVADVTAGQLADDGTQPLDRGRAFVDDDVVCGLLELAKNIGAAVAEHDQDDPSGQALTLDLLYEVRVA